MQFLFKLNSVSMRHIQYKCIFIPLILALIMLTAGCNPNSFLEETPNSFLTEENFYETEKDAVASVNAVYDMLQQGALYLNNMYRLVDFPSAQSTDNKRGGTLDLLTWDDTAGPVFEVWQGSYKGINRANEALANIPEIEMDENVKTRLLAEVHFLRGLYYFNLIKLFGNVVLKTEPTANLDSLNPSNTGNQEEVWSLIIEDLQYAETNLPLSYSGQDIGRATKGAAKTMLAKVYLQRSGLAKYAPDPSLWGVEGVNEWEEALNKTQEVIDLQQYSLFENYADVFDVSTKNGVEHIFSVQYLAGLGKPEGMANIVKMIGVRGAGNIHPYGGRSDWTGEPAFFDSWPNKESDERFPVTWVLEFELDGQTVRYPESDLMQTPHIQKFRINPGEKERLERFSANFPLIRYADVLLMHSEAANESGSGDTYAGINAVRQRAGLIVLSGLNQQELRAAIIQERALELCFEAHAFFDYQRFGILEEQAALAGHTG